MIYREKQKYKNALTFCFFKKTDSFKNTKNWYFYKNLPNTLWKISLVLSRNLSCFFSQSLILYFSLIMIAEMVVSGVEMTAKMAQAQEEIRVISFFGFLFYKYMLSFFGFFFFCKYCVDVWIIKYEN